MGRPVRSVRLSPMGRPVRSVRLSPAGRPVRSVLLSPIWGGLGLLPPAVLTYTSSNPRCPEKRCCSNSVRRAVAMQYQLVAIEPRRVPAVQLLQSQTESRAAFRPYRPCSLRRKGRAASRPYRSCSLRRKGRVRARATARTWGQSPADAGRSQELCGVRRRPPTWCCGPLTACFLI